MIILHKNFKENQTNRYLRVKPLWRTFVGGSWSEEHRKYDWQILENSYQKLFDKKLRFAKIDLINYRYQISRIYSGLDHLSALRQIIQQDKLSNFEIGNNWVPYLKPYFMWRHNITLTLLCRFKQEVLTIKNKRSF